MIRVLLADDQSLIRAGFRVLVEAATAAGDSVRNRRAYVAAVEERALRAEQSQEQEARRRVAEERLRIARELHDVVGHHIAVIKVQAAVASHLLHEQPEQADEAIGHIRRASRTVLGELGLLVNVLRDTSEPDSTQPAPGLAQLPELISGFEASGMPVTYVTAGLPRPLPALADLAAYRIVQESLTNAHKHGRGAKTTIEVGYFPRELSVRIHNTMPPAAMTGAAAIAAAATTGPEARGRPGDGARQPVRAGHGIVGMRERAVAVGGRLHAEPDRDGGFAVAASLPVPPSGREAAEAAAVAGSRLRREASDR